MYQHYTYIQQVNRLAYQSAEAGFDPFAALLMKDGQVKASTTDKSILYSDPTAHAELIVISEYCRQQKCIHLEGYTLYCNTEPCVMCSGAIHWTKIACVVFSVSQNTLQAFSGGKIKPTAAELINTGGARTEIVGPLLEEEGMSVFRDFPFQSKLARHKKYYGL